MPDGPTAPTPPTYARPIDEVRLEPNPGFEKLQDLVCVYQERIDRLVVDGVEHERAETYWS